MQIKLGTSRIVLILPSLGVVIKFPRIRLLDVFSEIWSMPKNSRFWKRLILFVRTSRNRGDYGLIPYLLNGLYANRSEYRFYRETKNVFAWPTTFSIGGLLNVQCVGIPARRDWGRIWSIMVDVMDRDIMKDLHCFENDTNFCEDDAGKLYLLDYASEKSQWLLQKHGAALREKL